MEEKDFRNKYRFFRKLGAGGMAEVYLAKQVGLAKFEKLVAVKTILPQVSGDEKFLQMFIDEARIAAQLSHANVVQVYDFGMSEGTLYIVMEFVHGLSLKALSKMCEEKGITLPLPIALHIIHTICRALDYAHNKKDLEGNPLNIIHRDVDPQNILISFEGGIKLGDFGVAKNTLQKHQTTYGEFKGKLHYTAPEALKSRHLDQRADIYSLGVTFYELLAGRMPFEEESPAQLMDKLCYIERPSIKEACPDLPDEIAQTIDKSIAHDRNNRYSSALEMVQEIEDFRDGYIKGDGSLLIANFFKENFPELLDVPVLSEDAMQSDMEVIPTTSLSKILKAGRRSESAGRKDIDLAPTRMDRPSARRAAKREKRLLPIILLAAFGIAFILLFLFIFNGPEPPINTNDSISGISFNKPVIPKATPEPIPEPALENLIETKATPAPVMEKAYGYLIANVDPKGASLSLNGKGLGTVNAPKKIKITAGQKVSISASKPGFESKTLTASVAENGTKSISISLVAMPGSVSIGSDVGCQVSINGAQVGFTPIASHKVSAGSHTVSCYSQTLDSTISRKVKVPGGANRSVNLTFLATLNVSVEPWAEVYLDGAKIGVTPIAKKGIKPGSHKVRLVNGKLGKDMVKVLEFKPGKVVFVSETFTE